MSTPAALPFLTADIPGCGGAFKMVPEDFVVEELPAYEPSGEGEHLFIGIEKLGVDTQGVARALARALGITERDVSTAGQKDRQALTRQTFCVPAKVEEKLGAFSMEGVRVLWSKRHRNKLRTGHLKGNRFVLVLRGVSDRAAAEACLARLRQHGAPNYFGQQRFGRAGDNAARGKALLLGARERVSPFERKMFLSALQSELFNAALVERIGAGTFTRALAGDVLRKEDTGGIFVCESPEIDQPRVEALEVSPTGPMFGPEMMVARGEVAALEQRLLEQAGLTAEAFARGGKLTSGTRRPYRVLLESVASPAGSGDLLSLDFVLPPGAYATSVLRELLKV